MSKIIIGLGNPGEQYQATRHNVGYRAVDAIAKHLNVQFDKKQFNGVFGTTMINEEKIILAKPETYMNLSGDFVSQFMKYYNVSNEEIIVIFDDVDIPLGELKLRTTGSSGGQNGIKDIIVKIHTDQFKRIKIGIGPKNTNMNLSDFVLSNFNKNDNQKLNTVILTVVKIIDNLNQTNFSNLIDYVQRKKI